MLWAGWVSATYLRDSQDECGRGSARAQPRSRRQGKGDRQIRAVIVAGESTHGADDDGDDAKEPICPRRTPGSHQALRHLYVSLHIFIRGYVRSECRSSCAMRRTTE